MGQKEPRLPAPQEGCRHSLFIQPGANSEPGRWRAEIQTQFWFARQTQPPSAGPPLGPFSTAYFRVVPGLPAPCVTFTDPTFQSRVLHSKGPGKGSPGKQGTGKCQGRKEGRERHGPVRLHFIRATLSPGARLVWEGMRLRPWGLGGDSDSSYAHTSKDSPCVCNQPRPRLPSDTGVGPGHRGQTLLSPTLCALPEGSQKNKESAT